jgi:Cthe_2314-like HEPN
LSALPNIAIFKQVKDFRNNIVHNYRPNQIDSGYKRVNNADGSQTKTMSIGNYTTSTEFLNNIRDNLDLLADIIDEIRDKVKEEE